MSENFWRNAPQTVNALTEALNTFDWAQARTICCHLVADINVASVPFPGEAAIQILNKLRRKRQFELMEMVSDALLLAGEPMAQVRRQFAQCLIDQGKFSAADAVLDGIIADPKSPLEEIVEAKGLAGRIYKQIYVNSHDPSNVRQQANLRRAVLQYYDVYQSEPGSRFWHGINSVALLARAARDKVEAPGFPDPKEIARKLDASLKQLSELNLWNRATAVENAVALNDWNAAYDHVLYFVADESVDAFEVESLLRQLTEVWELRDDQEPGSTLLPTLKAALLKKQGGCLTIRQGGIGSAMNAAQGARKNLERVFGNDRYQPLAWYRLGLQRCAAVARIEAVTGQRIGTGFLVRASAFFPKRGEKELLLLTNAHVISPIDQPFSGALPPQAAVAVFEANNQTYKLDEIVLSSDPDHLDFTFVTLKAGSESAEICPLEPPPASFTRDKQQRVYVIGYPEGGGLSFSLQDSVWLDTDGSKLHYRTPTNPGSSGSPVFDEQFWTLLALHHAGGEAMNRLNGAAGTYQANEGIAISAIQQFTRQAKQPAAATATG